MWVRTDYLGWWTKGSRLPPLVTGAPDDALDAALAHGDVAALLMEPARTNIGIVLPQPGYHDAVREITRRHGVLLIIDETHTISAGPGGCTRAWGLDPDIVVIGKPIGGGFPVATYGVTVTEDCDFTVTYVDSQNGTCPVTITRTFTAIDECLNETTLTQTITMLK